MTKDRTALFNPTSLAGWPAWAQAWSQVVDPKHGLVNPAREVAPYRAALAAAFVPLLHEMAEAYAPACDVREALTLKASSEQQERTQAMDMEMAIVEPFKRLITDALSAGLLPTVVTTMAQGTDLSLGNVHGRDLWGKVPAMYLGEQVLLALLGEHRYYKLDHPFAATLEWLAHDPANAPFWDGWAREVGTTRYRLNVSPGDNLASVVGDLIARTVRDMNALPALTTVVDRLGTIKQWHQYGWGHTGYSAASAIKGSFTSIRSPEHDALYAIAPQTFWDGVRSEVLYTSRLGGWIHTNALRTAATDPHGPLAQDMVVKAWLNLDKKEILALEEAMPGSTQEHLPAVLKVGEVIGHPHIASTDTVREALNAPRGRWALATFKRAGAPVDKNDLRYDNAFSEWQKAHPQGTAQTLLALHARIEADQLKKALKTDDQPAPRLARAVPRRL